MAEGNEKISNDIILAGSGRLESMLVVDQCFSLLFVSVHV